MKRGLPGSWAGVLLLAAAAAAEAPPPAATATAGAFAALASEAEAGGHPVVVGRDGWLLLTAELRHLGLPPFWGAPSAQLSRATRPDARDPMPAILDFKAQLDRAGIALLLVPVPAKAAVYPALPAMAAGAVRPDAVDAEFYDVLRAQGVDVLDLQPVFAAEAAERRLYCQQDSHWSGAGAERAAALIADWLRARGVLADTSREKFESERRDVTIDGDLWTMLGESARPRERLPLRFVGRRTGAGLEPVAPLRESPVLLLADSHGLVFHAGGDMHARGAGLADQLALELGLPLDVVAVRGSGATPARISLFRRRDQLAGKKAVIWTLSAREFTESVQGWRLVPIIE